MCGFVHVFLIWCYLIVNTEAIECFSSVCQNLTLPSPMLTSYCPLKAIKNDEDCINLKFESLTHIPPKEDTASVQLSAYVKEVDSLIDGRVGKVTAFNLSVVNTNFHSLIIRYQNLVNSNLTVCTRIELFDNITQLFSEQLNIYCLFSDGVYEGNAYRLEYLISGENYEYSRKIIFNVPEHRFMENLDVNMSVPFMYVDISDSSILTLSIQPLPERLNVTKYRIILINNDTNSMVTTDVFSNTTDHIHRNFTVHNGVYYFVVEALHPDCGEEGCISSISPFIKIRKVSDRLLIMIISMIWIPPVIMYAIYHAYKLYKKNEASKRHGTKPNCLLLYLPTHEAHVNVMADLTRYLQSCNINAMIDIFDNSQSSNKVDEQWYEAAFNCAEFILIAGSPHSGKTESKLRQTLAPPILRLIREHIFSRSNKRFYVLQLPYCKPDDVPEAARRFRRFFIPQELSTLIRTIHGVEYIRFFGVTNKEFLDSVKIAELEILEGENISKNVDETDDLLPSTDSQKLDQVKSRSIPVGMNLLRSGEGEGLALKFSNDTDDSITKRDA